MELEFGSGAGCADVLVLVQGGQMRWSLIQPHIRDVYRVALSMGGRCFTCPLNVEGWGVFRIAGEGYDMLKHLPTQAAAEMWMIHHGA